MPTINNNGTVTEFDVEDDNQDVETANGEDENQDDDLDKDDDAAGDGDGSDDNNDDDDSGDGDDDDNKSEDAKFDKRYTQLKGDTPEEYAKSLEEAYNQSSAEGVRINKELTDLKQKVGGILAAAEKNPELAKQLGLTETDTSAVKQDATKTPAETYAEQLMNERMETEYREFTELHPEVDTDETLRKDLIDEVGVQSAAYKAKTGRIISMKDAMNRAWKVLGYDDNSKEDLAVKAKENAGQGRTQGASSKKNAGSKKPQVSDAAMEMAKKMGLSEKDVSKYYKP